MASSISSFPFFPTTAPAYAPCRFSPAATYPPAPFPGGYHTSAFPYSGAYPYPPPADAYTPAHGFSPNRPNWPPHAPDPTPPTAPSQLTTSSISPVSGTLSVVNASSCHLSLMQDDAVVQAAVDERVPAKDAIDTIQGQLAKLISMSSQLAVAMGKQATEMLVTESFPKISRRRPPVTPHPSPRSETSSVLEISVEAPLFALQVANGSVLTEREPVQYASTGHQNLQNTADDTVLNQASAPEPTEPATLDHFAHKRVHSQNLLEQQEHYLQSIQGEVASLRERVVQLVSMQQIHDGKIASQTSGFGVQLETQISELPECYGLENLNRHSLFRADGTEHSFYGLPENYLLDQATLGPVFDSYDDDMDDCSTEFFDVFLGTPEQQKSDQSANCFREAYLNAFSEDTSERVSHAYDVDTKGRADESVHVFASPPEQQPYEAKQQESEQLLKCVSKAPENEQTIACLNYISDIFDSTLELQQQDEEKADNCSVLKASDSFVTRSSHVSIECSMREVWDLGVSASLHSSKSKPPKELSYVTMFVPEVLTLCIQAGSYVQQLRDSRWSVLVTHESRKEWDPGDNTILSSTLNRDIVALWNYGIQFLWDPSILRWRTISAQHILESGSFVSTERMLPWNPWYSILLLHQILLEFSMDKVPSKCAVLNLMNLKHFCAQLLLQYHSWCTTQNIILQGLYVHIIQPVHRSAIHAYYLVHALLPPTQTASFESSNVEVGELTSRCLGFHLHQINNSTSTTPGVITSFEYAHTVGFLNGQCEYIHQRGVQVNHNAKQLLVSSKNCLHIWKVDILFTTFLPP